MNPPSAVAPPDRTTRWLHARIVPAAFALLVAAYAWLTPPFRVPDEFNHYFRAYQISEGRFIGRRLPQGFCGDELPASLQEVATAVADYPGIPRREFSRGRWEQGAAILLDSQRRSPTNFPNTVLYSPLNYAPAALAVAVGRLFDAPPLLLLYFGRMANAVAAIVLLALALRRLPLQKDSLCVIALLPMTLAQIGSVSSDSFMFALTFFWLACSLAFTRATGALKKSEAAVFLLTAAAVGQLRPPNCLLMFVALEPKIWRQDFDRDRRKLCFIALGIAAALGTIWFLATKHLIVPLDPGGMTDPSGQLGFVVQHPWSFLVALTRTIGAQIVDYWQMMLGVLGWLDTALPFWVYLGLTLALVVSTMLRESQEEISPWLRVWMIILAAGMGFLVFLAFYQIWSPVGADLISGIQGRYFIPLLLPVAIAQSSRLLANYRRASWIRCGVFLFAVFANLAALRIVAAAGV